MQLMDIFTEAKIVISDDELSYRTNYLKIDRLKKYKDI